MDNFQEPEQEPTSAHAHRCAMNHFAFASCDCGVAKFAELRAKVEALPVVDTTEVPDWHAVYLHAVLAEIDKLGGKV